jgi:ketosteroid isomerase-like protein
MSSERVELVKRGYEAWNKGDRSWVLEHMSEDVEWITPPEDPDPGTYRGYEGVERFWSQWRAAVGQLEFRVEEIAEVGDHVVVTARRSGRGEHSGLEGRAVRPSDGAARPRRRGRRRTMRRHPASC